jgi:hypothetical protein
LAALAIPRFAGLIPFIDEIMQETTMQREESPRARPHSRGDSVTKYILHPAVAQGGTVRAFNQGSDSKACTVYSSDWLIGRILGDDRVFAKASRTGKEAPALVDWAKAPLKDSLDYVIKHVPKGDKILVTTTDYLPAPEYAAQATKTKNGWET